MGPFAHGLTLRLALASPEHVRAQSAGEVLLPETLHHRTLQPVPNGLCCPRIFGPERDWQCACGRVRGRRSEGRRCARCGVTVGRAHARRERFGHIERATPCVHPWFASGKPSPLALLLDLPDGVLQALIAHQQALVLAIDETVRAERLANLAAADRAPWRSVGAPDAGGLAGEIDAPAAPSEDARLHTWLAQLQVGDVLESAELQVLEGLGATGIHTATGGAALRDLLGRLDLDRLAHNLRAQLEHVERTVRETAAARLRVVEPLRRSGSRPEWLVLEVLPVLPPTLRPILAMSDDCRATADLNELYGLVLRRNGRLKRLAELGAPELLLRVERQLLQTAVAALLAGPPATGTSGPVTRRPLKGLAGRLEGKEGRFRQNLLGKRVDFSARSVITAGPELRLHQVGLPKALALELFRPFVQHVLLRRGHAASTRHARRLIERARPPDVVWDALAEALEGRLVLLNRAPTLHRPSLQAFQPVLAEGQAIRLHPLVCAGFNADFDGDQMAVHLPLGAPAQQEARERLWSVHNLLAPSSGEPSTAPTLDIVLGLHALTRARPEARGAGCLFADPADARLAADLGVVELQAPVRVRLIGADGGRRMVDTTPGRVLLTEALNGVLRGRGLPELPLLEGVATRASLRALVLRLVRTYGDWAAAECLDELKRLGFEHATKSGTTFNALER